MKQLRKPLTFVNGGLLVAAGALAACSGGGGHASSVPSAATTAPPANVASGANGTKGKSRAALTMILGSAKVSRTQTKVRAKSNARTLKGARRPQYLDQLDTDSLYIYEYDQNGDPIGSESFDVSLATGTQGYPNTGPTGTQPCWALTSGSSTLRECDLTFSASPGIETFFVQAVCEVNTLNGGYGACVDGTQTTLSVGVSTVPITAGQSNTFDVTMEPILAPNQLTYQLFGNLGVSVYNGICTSEIYACTLFTFDSAASAGSIGVVQLAPYDGGGDFGALIPQLKPDPNPAHYSGGSTPMVSNYDSFALLPNPLPATSIAADSLSATSISEQNYTGGSAPGYIYYSDPSCSSATPPPSYGDAFDAITGSGTSVCYDGSAGATTTSDSPQYYAWANAQNSNSARLATIFLAPILVNLSASPQSDCGTASGACIQFGVYGYFATTLANNYPSGDTVTASLTQGNCPSSWSMQAFGTGSNNSGGTNTYDTTSGFGHVSTAQNDSGGTVNITSAIDDSGYAQFLLSPGSSGTMCTVIFQADQGTSFASTAVSRTYESNGTSISIFGKNRKAR